MKALTRTVSALALSAALTLGAAPAAFADSTASYEGHEAVFAFSEGTEYHATDLFDGLKDVMPGDELNQKVTVANKGDLEIVVYLSAEAHDEEGNPLEYSEAFEEADLKDGGKDPEAGDALGGPGERDEDVASMADFLAQLTLKVALGDRVLFEGAPHQPGALSEPAMLARLAPGESVQLDVALSVPAELGNEYAYRVGEVDWVFTVEEPDPVLPDTGDTSPMALIAAVALCALAAALLLAALRRRADAR